MGYQGNIFIEDDEVNKFPDKNFAHIIECKDKLLDNQFDYEHFLYLKASLLFSPNFGMLANDTFKANFYMLIKYYLNPIEKNEGGLEGDLGFKLEM